MHNDHVYNASFMPFLKNAKTNTYDHNSVNIILCHLFTSMVFLHIAVLLLTNISYQIHTFKQRKKQKQKQKQKNQEHKKKIKK